MKSQRAFEKVKFKNLLRRWEKETWKEPFFSKWLAKASLTYYTGLQKKFRFSIDVWYYFFCCLRQGICLWHSFCLISSSFFCGERGHLHIVTEKLFFENNWHQRVSYWHFFLLRTAVLRNALSWKIHWFFFRNLQRSSSLTFSRYFFLLPANIKPNSNFSNLYIPAYQSTRNFTLISKMYNLIGLSF